MSSGTRPTGESLEITDSAIAFLSAGQCRDSHSSLHNLPKMARIGPGRALRSRSVSIPDRKDQAMYHQTYNPLGNVFLSTLVAAIPILTLLYFIALHRYRDEQGNVHLGISAPYAAFFGVIAAFVVACLAFGMPVAAAA